MTAISLDNTTIQTVILLVGFFMSVLTQIIHFSKKMAVYDAKLCYLSKQISEMKNKLDDIEKRVYDIAKSIKL
ncbi:MAG: hypothetical protein DRI61_09590 [Chloroflexi bacterium]|nr:MAG: hypothetical protein DRI61_09590 [Chloroflexota bacterium]